jgi:hypothetical protein
MKTKLGYKKVHPRIPGMKNGSPTILLFAKRCYQPGNAEPQLGGVDVSKC